MAVSVGKSQRRGASGAATGRPVLENKPFAAGAEYGQARCFDRIPAVTA